jgi:hypothetical protein
MEGGNLTERHDLNSHHHLREYADATRCILHQSAEVALSEETAQSVRFRIVWQGKPGPGRLA